MKPTGKFVFLALAGLLCSASAALAQTINLTATPTSVNLGTYRIGSGTAPAAQTVTVTSSAGATLIGISLNGSGPYLFAAVPPSGMGAGATTPAPLTIRPAPTSILDSLPVGSHNGTFSIFGPAGSNTPVVTVT